MEKLYEQDAYLRAFDAKVLSCVQGKGGWDVILDRTAFYPEGGGQPYDTGTLGNVKVLQVHTRGEDVVHTCDGPLEPGSRVSGQIDWDRRFDLMQNHSGEHIVSGIANAWWGCDNVGFHMGSDFITIDLNTMIDEEQLRQLEEAVNRYLWQDKPVLVTYPTPEELETLDYRSKKELEGQVRIVNVGEYDCCACCGTHVKLAGEIGQIKIIGAQNCKGGTRLELLCGKRALQEFRKKNDVSAEVGRLLSVPAVKADSAVKNVLAERDELVQNLNQLKWKYFTLKAEQVPEGTENILFFGEGLNSKDLTHFADLLLQKGAKRAAVFSKADEGYVFVLLSAEKDARAYTDEMKEPFGCKGGGKPDAVQGRVAAEKKALKNFFADKEFLIAE